MREEGISRYDLGREGFLEKAWSWKEEYASIIRASTLACVAIPAWSIPGSHKAS